MQFNKDTAIACVITAAATAAVTCFCVRNSCYNRCPAGAGGKGGAVSEKDHNDTISRERYETDYLARQYLEFHFTKSAETFKDYPLNAIEKARDFPTRLAKKFTDFKPTKMGRIMDLGCAVGVTSIEMARDFDEVVGIDLSSAFIQMANKVKNEGGIKFEAPDQGQLSIPRSYTVPKEIDTSKILFEVGDALAIDPKLGNFDGLLAANLLCRVPDGEQLFKQFEERINQGGILVLVSPYSWTEEACPLNKWTGGCNGVRSEDAVKARLSKTFELLDDQYEPFMIRDHGRRFQLGFSHCTVWRRK